MTESDRRKLVERAIQCIDDAVVVFEPELSRDDFWKLMAAKQVLNNAAMTEQELRIWNQEENPR